MNTTFTTCAEKKAKQFLNLLQGYTKGIRMTAILILLVMGVSNAWGAKQRYIYVGISDKFDAIKTDNQWGFNFWGGTGEGVKSGTWIENITHDGRQYHMFRVQVYDDNNKAQFKVNDSWWEPAGGIDVTLNGTNNNAIFFTHGDDGGWWRWQQDYQVTSSASLKANKTSALVGESVTLRPSLSSNATYNQIKSTTYTVSTNPGSGGSVTSAGVFSATKAGTYTVTATVTYNAKDFTGITKTASATQTIKVYDTQYVLRGSQAATGDPKGGMAGWDATNNNAYTSATINGTTMTIVATLTNAKTQYKFMIYNNFDGSYYGQTGSAEIPNNTSWTLNGSKDVKFTTTAAGPYTFVYNTSTKLIKVQYPAAYTVTYGIHSSGGGNLTATANGAAITSGTYVKENQTIVFTAKPEQGYQVEGWYSDANCTAKLGNGYSISNENNICTIQNLTKTETVYVKFKENTFDVTVTVNNAKGGTTEPSGLQSQIGQVTGMNIAANVNSGYQFIGWDFERGAGAFGAANAASTTFKPSQESTIRANFEPNTYTITYNDLHGVTHSNPPTYTIESETITFTNPISERTGYTFAGWYPTQITKGSTGNQTVSALWTANTYTVTLDQTGAASTGTEEVIAHYEADMPDIDELPVAQIGYTFMGYFDQKDGKGTQYYKANGTSEHPWDKTGNATLYAYFKAAEITINLNAASFEPNSATPVIATATLTPTPVGTTSICWELLYNDDTPVAEHDPQPTGEPNQVQFNINDLATGTYQIKATLREGTGCTGTIISHATQVFTITSDHTITIKYVDENGQTIKASTTQSAHVSSLTEITAPEIIGYTFKEWEAGDGVSIKDATDGKKNTPDIEYNAYYDGYLKAIYTKNSNIIYFYNTLGWENVYVYFYNGDYWEEPYGTGTKNGSSCTGSAEMTQITGTDIWYVDASKKNTTYLVFGKDQQNNEQWFYNTSVARRGDYNSKLPMFVPIADQNPEIRNKYTNGGKNYETKYYNKGYWMNYPNHTGYTLDLFNHHSANDPARYFIYPYSQDTIFPLQIQVDINAENIADDGKKKIWFRIHRNDGKNFGGNANTFPSVKPGTTGGFIAENDYKVELITPIAGTYTFILDYKYDETAKDYQYHIEVDYPAKVGDYRILYSDEAETNWSGNTKPVGWYHPSRIIKKKEDAKDIISFFINHDKDPELQYQTITDIDAATGKITWSNAQDIRVDWSQIGTSGVYNFVFVQDGEGISLENTIEPYTGNYYIRCDAVGGKWDNYKTDKENRMTYSAFSESDANSFGQKYSHYVTKYCPHSTNIKFTIANDYSPCISDTLVRDFGANNTVNPFGNLDENGTLITDGNNNDKYSANVRFMWNHKTNKISRAYIGRAVTNDFLVITGNKQLQKSDGNTLRDTIVFFDTQNWIYEVKMKVQPTTRVKVHAAYPAGAGESGAQYFCGAYNNDAFNNDEDSKLALGGDVDDQNYYSIRVLYDFKTNRLLMAWMPSGDTENVDGTKTISADVMLIRDHQNPAQCITFANEDSKLSEVKTVYGSMRFNRWVLNNRGGQNNFDVNSCGGEDSYDENTTNSNHPVLQPAEQKSQYERALYFISFPFDVNLSDVFGFGTYGQHWIIEYYDGLKRAREGYWIDSDPNWKYVTNPDEFVLEKYKGYILCLNLSKMAYNNTDFWAHNISQVELFFPSTTTMEEIAKAEVTMPALGDEYLCTINRNTPEGDRRVKDSYWRCIGVPSYANYSNVLKDEEGDPIQWQTSYKTFPFLYKWNKTDNTLTPQSTTNFKFETMHAYLVQNGGEIHWSAVNATPDKPNAGIIAKVKETTRNYEWRIAISRNGEVEDQAFVRLSDDEQVTTEFDFNQDLSKEFNYGRSDIYTLIGYEKVAANSLPLSEQTTLIPLGLSIEYNGDYTIAMPDGTANIGVTLIDTESNTRTNLSAGMEYTLTLKKGDYNNRFFIEISPIQQTPTDIEYVENSHDDQARKVLIDNILYIVRDGQMFDARGARVK